MKRTPQALAKRKIGKTEWEVLPSVEQALLPVLEELEKPKTRRDAPVLRSGPGGALVFTMKTNRPNLPPELFIKSWSRKGVSAAFFSLFTDSPASRQWRSAREHEQRGLPIPEHLALGKRRESFFSRTEFLIEESLPGFEPFDSFARAALRPELPGVSPGDKRKVVQEAARLIRSMHDLGVSRPKLAPGDILASSGPGGGARLLFVDLHRAVVSRVPKPIPFDKRIQELASFNHHATALFSQAYRIRFFREYFRKDRLSSQDFKNTVKRIISVSERQAKQEEKMVERGVWKRKDPYFWFDTDEGRVFLRKPLYQNSVMEVLRELASAEARTRVRVKRVEGHPPLELLAVRCESEAGNKKRGKAGRDPAERAFFASALMDHHRIPHFRVMAAQSGVRGRASYILYEVPERGDYTLAEYLARRVAEEFSGVAWDRKFLIRVARFLLLLHERGWGYPRPRGDDLWVRCSEAGTHELMLFNIDRLEKINLADGERLLRNIFELWRALPISRADGIFLADEYMKFSTPLKQERRRWLRRFMEWQA